MAHLPTSILDSGFPNVGRTDASYLPPRRFGALQSAARGRRRRVAWSPLSPPPARCSAPPSRSRSSVWHRRLEGLFCVVLTAVETKVHLALDAAPQRLEHGGYRQGGCHCRDLGLLAPVDDLAVSFWRKKSYDRDPCRCTGVEGCGEG